MKPDPRQEPLGVFGGFRVFLVNGTLIRDHIDVDFTMGANGGRYVWCPKSELWIDRDLSDKDRRATILHEVVETRLMLDRGQPYNQGHQNANVFERLFRAAAPAPPIEQAVEDALRTLGMR